MVEWVDDTRGSGRQGMSGRPGSAAMLLAGCAIAALMSGYAQAQQASPAAGGGTQVDHFDDDRGFVAPRLSYRPDGTTTLTFLGQYQRDFTDPNQFLPYQGSVRPTPYGRIPTSLFTGDTASSTFEREQSFLGYEFEHSFAGNLTVRQNLRYSTVDVRDRGPIAYADGGGTGDSAQLLRHDFLTRDRGRELTVDNQL